MNIKKIIVTTILFILLPYIILFLFFKKEENLYFEYGENTLVKVKRESQNKIEEVPLEEYVVGVLAGEMPVSFDIEALKAQAVAARSYVLKKMEKSNGEYDIVDTVSNQVYYNEEELKEKWKDGYNQKIEKVKKAVKATKGQYLEYNGEVIEAFFFSTSTGATENSGEVFSTQLPYLKSVESKWDAEVSPVFEVAYDFSLSDFYTKLDLPYQKTLKIEITNQTSTGRIKKLKINGKLFNASDVFAKLKLKSTFFKIEQMGSNVHITTKGYGHGVGMSQYGAYGMAKNGYTYDQILQHYYQGTNLKTLKS